MTSPTPLYENKVATSSSESATSLATCNPLSSTGCSADPALATAISDDFHSESKHYSPYRTPSKISYSDDGLNLTLSKQYDNPSLVSNYYIMFGRMEVMLKSASGTGVISSFYLQSDDLDEIDFEWFGGYGYEVQSNFFSKGNTTTYDRGEYHQMDDPRADFHNYTVDWTSDALKWYLDGTLIRTLDSNSSSGYPQSPMRVYFGVWAGGDSSNTEGVIEWAGGLTDYTLAPFNMQIQKLVVTDYSTGSEYKYTDDTGDWSSIQAVDGKIMGRQAKGVSEFSSLVEGEEISSSNTTDITDTTGSSETSSESENLSASITSSSEATDSSTLTGSDTTISTITTSGSSSSSSLASSINSTDGALGLENSLSALAAGLLFVVSLL
ncbi:hypothetical protein FOA43_002545 [Brettanomyces nanus]|uniref:Crh-like protein n=1 Tax=Eeniella nana TaxID=13502 RepID=A0A875S4A0_EENNA|nr:uncharacterized protein FOA43_002545 [Brettanomyces nanus]QPG75195.1 hypothetical protein FOA43_002545 [Brettanomyces nanus]